MERAELRTTLRGRKRSTLFNPRKMIKKTKNGGEQDM